MGVDWNILTKNEYLQRHRSKPPDALTGTQPLTRPSTSISGCNNPDSSKHDILADLCQMRANPPL
ncbi:hypothetical protein P7K49_003931, partial [Saguinus oedipus]